MLIAFTAKNVLLGIGGPIELLGIVLIALDIVAPTFRAAVGAVIRTKQRVLERIRSGFAHLRGDLHTVVARAGMPIEVTVGAAVVKKPADDASPEEALSVLVEVSVETQEQLHRLQSQFTGLSDQMQRAIDDVRRQFELAIENAVSESEGAYLQWQAAGFVLAVSGATLVFIASII